MTKSIVNILSSLGVTTGLLLGYEICIMSGVIIQPNFIGYFGYMREIHVLLKGGFGSSLLVGCFLGSVLSGNIRQYLSEKFLILISSIILALGTALQVASSTWYLLLAGRAIAGLSIGALNVAVPSYQSGIVSPHLRSRLEFAGRIAIFIGILLAFIVNYVLYFIQSELSWRIPLGLPIIPSVIIGIRSILMPHTPDWLIRKNWDEKAKQVLAKLRANGNPNDERVIAEFNQISERVKVECDPTVLEKVQEFATRPIITEEDGHYYIQILQQLSGIGCILHYGPDIFMNAGFVRVSSGLLAQAINGIVIVLSVIFTIFYLDKKLNRRKAAMLGAMIMSVTMITVGILMLFFSAKVPNYDGNLVISINYLSVTFIIVALVFVYTMGFAFTWASDGWMYPAELFPNKLDSHHIEFAHPTNWFSMAIIVQFSPFLMETINYGLYLIFAAFCTFTIIHVYHYCNETKDKEDEGEDELLHDSSETNQNNN